MGPRHSAPRRRAAVEVADFRHRGRPALDGSVGDEDVADPRSLHGAVAALTLDGRAGFCEERKQCQRGCRPALSQLRLGQIHESVKRLRYRVRRRLEHMSFGENLVDCHPRQAVAESTCQPKLELSVTVVAKRTSVRLGSIDRSARAANRSGSRGRASARTPPHSSPPAE
jgi:hypothetical protein